MLLVQPMQPYHGQHLALRVVDAQQRELLADPVYCVSLATVGQAYTAVHDGETVCCMGVIPIHAGVAQGWGLIPPGMSLRIMAHIRNGARSFLDACDYRRVQIAVAVRHAGGHSFARGLGFVDECLMRAWMPDGSDAVQYVRIRNG
jgi:hypothetical protein